MIFQIKWQYAYKKWWGQLEVWVIHRGPGLALYIWAQLPLSRAIIYLFKNQEQKSGGLRLHFTGFAKSLSLLCTSVSYICRMGVMFSSFQRGCESYVPVINIKKPIFESTMYCHFVWISIRYIFLWQSLPKLPFTHTMKKYSIFRSILILVGLIWFTLKSMENLLISKRAMWRKLGVYEKKKRMRIIRHKITKNPTSNCILSA